MTPEEETLLRDIGVLLLGNLAGFTAMTLVYGVFVLLFSICSYKIGNRGFKDRATAVVFTTAVITFLIATVYWCAYLASFATLVRGILVDTDIGPLDNGGSFEGINRKNLRFVRMQSWTAQLLPMISDAVLVWRVRVMYPTKRWILIAPIALLAGTIGSGFGLLGVISSEDYNVTGVLGATLLWEKIFLSYLSLSLATNVVCSSLVTAHMIRLQRAKGNIGKQLKMSQLRVLSIVLVETGILYAAAQAINLAFELVKPKSDSPLYFAMVVITSIYAVCTAMYPTIVILLQVIQRSTLHLFKEIEIIAKKSDVAVKSGAARPATMGHLSFARAATQQTQNQTNATDMTGSTPQILSFSIDGTPEKAKTIVDSSEHLDEKLDSNKHTKTAPF